MRSVPKVLSASDAEEMIRRLGFYDRYKNSEGKGLGNKYNLREINNNNVVLDEATGLMWQQSGSENYMRYKKAEKWISELNQKSFASFSDWRLPTLEEAISLIEPES